MCCFSSFIVWCSVVVTSSRTALWFGEAIHCLWYLYLLNLYIYITFQKQVIILSMSKGETEKEDGLLLQVEVGLGGNLEKDQGQTLWWADIWAEPGMSEGVRMQTLGKPDPGRSQSIVNAVLFVNYISINLENLINWKLKEKYSK